MRSPTTTTDPRLARAVAHERAMAAAAASQVVDLPWGQAFLSPEIGRCYDRNLLWVYGGGPGVDAPALHAEAHRLLGGAGLAHRRIVAEDPLARTLGPGFAALGYREARHVVLVHDGPAPGADDRVAEITIDELAEANDRWLRRDPDVAAIGADDRVRHDLVEHQRTFGSAGADERVLAVRAGGRPVAWAKLWRRGDVAQVEDVVVDHEHRGRGLGRAVVATATAAALAGEPRLVLIMADDDDWPKQLYGRLGYVPVGLRRLFTLER